MYYSKLGWTAVMAAFAVSVGVTPAAAKGGNAKAKQPTVRVTSAKAKPVKATKAGPSAMAGAKTKAPTPKGKAAGASGAKAKTTGQVSGTPAVAKKEGAPAPTLSAKETQPADVNPISTVPLNKAQQQLMKNANLRLKMQTRLGGMDPVVAASGFKNLGQFVATVNASGNDPSQFRALRALMTGESPMSLGQAKKQLKNTQPPVVTTTVTTVPTASDQR